MARTCPSCRSENPDGSQFCSTCGTKLGKAPTPKGPDASFTKTFVTPQKELTVGAILAAKYEILEEIGRGGMGIVYKAEDIKLKRPVALKFIPPDLADNPERRERFLVEARAAAALSHPNVCTIYEVDEASERPFIAMEFVEGQSIGEIIRKGSLSSETALDIAMQVAAGLEEAHKKGIIHRDIKSANIMVTPGGQAKVMDFGLAKVTGGATLTREGATMGTVAYMSPEQARGEPVDKRTDIWSWGVVFYEMLCAELPFQGDREASILYSVIHEEPRPFKESKPPIPPELRRIISRALEKKPEDRYASAGAMLKDLRGVLDLLRAESSGALTLRTFIRRVRRPRIAIPVSLGIIAIALLLFWYFDRQAKVRWAEEVALPELQRLADVAPPIESYQKSVRVFELAEKAGRYISGHPEFQKVLLNCMVSPTVETQPAGARVFVKEYVSPDKEWKLLGRTPLKGLKMPFIFYRWKVEKERYETVFFVSEPSGPIGPGVDPKMIPLRMTIILHEEGTTPPGMVRIPVLRTHIDGLGPLFGLPEYVLPDDFFIDRFEVTNRQYREFVRDGGYRKKEYWKHDFIKDGKKLGWEEAMSLLVDKTGRPGPESWEAGDYPEGEADFPVYGVSWYEAAAYAEYARKSLPTARHWKAATGMMGPGMKNVGGVFPLFLYPLSNLKGSRPVPVGSSQAESIYGVYDMAGNIREWCLNDAQKGKILCGAAFGEPVYLFDGFSAAPPFDRSLKNGFRCVKYIAPEKIPSEDFAPIEVKEIRDYFREIPVSDEVFKVLKGRFDYDPTDLGAVVEYRDEAPEEWIKEKTVINAAYGGERLAVYLYLPKNAQPPFQTVVYFPGDGGMDDDADKVMDKGQFAVADFFPKNGRALVFPVYKGMFERREAYIDEMKLGTRQHADYWIQLVKDCRRAIDYLEIRKDIDISKLGFFGYSWGFRMAPHILAVDDRIKAGAVFSGGLWKNKSSEEYPLESDPFHFLPRIKQPLLILNGRYDYFFPPEVSVEPIKEFVGTPDKDVKILLYDTDHWVPREDMIRETLDWLDKYFGPVK